MCDACHPYTHITCLAVACDSLAAEKLKNDQRREREETRRASLPLIGVGAERRREKRRGEREKELVQELHVARGAHE